MIGAGLAVPLGVLMARLRGRGWDVMLQIGSVAGLAVPSFWLGIMMVLLLAHFAPDLQLLGYVPFSQNPAFGDLKRLMLPAFALALPISPIYRG